jgi:hypothetical protein
VDWDKKDLEDTKDSQEVQDSLVFEVTKGHQEVQDLKLVSVIEVLWEVQVNQGHKVQAELPKDSTLFFTHKILTFPLVRTNITKCGKDTLSCILLVMANLIPKILEIQDHASDRSVRCRSYSATDMIVVNTPHEMTSSIG